MGSTGLRTQSSARSRAVTRIEFPVRGIHNNTTAYALKMIADSFQFITLASDSRFLAARASEEMAALRGTGVKSGRPPAYWLARALQ